MTSVILPGTPEYEKTLATAAQQLPGGQLYPYLRQGKVTAVDKVNRLATVQIGGDTSTDIAGVRYQYGYFPQANDDIWLLQNGSSRQIIGSLNDTTGAPKARMQSILEQDTSNASGEVKWTGFTNSDVDTDGLVDLGNDEFVIQTPGIYLMGFVIRSRSASAGSGRRVCDLTINNSFTPLNVVARQEGFSDKPIFLSASGMASLSANDTIQLYIYGGDSGQPNVTWGDTNYRTRLWITYLL